MKLYTSLAWLMLMTSLHAKEAEEYFDNPNSETLKTVLTDLNAEPSSIVAGCMNVITGDYVEFDVDLVIPGPEPIQIQRSHSSSDTGCSLLYQAWRSNQQSSIRLQFIKTRVHQEVKASYLGPCGERMHFEGESKQKDDTVTMKPQKKMYEKGLTNTSKGEISGQTHPKNTRLFYDNDGRENCTLKLGSGEMHRFRRYGKDHYYLLYEIVKPTGMQFHYTLNNDKLLSIELRNRAGAEVSRAYVLYDAFPNKEKHVHWVTFQEPYGRAVNYRFQDFSKKRDYYILTDVHRSDGPGVHYVLDEPHYKAGERGDWSGNMERVKRKELPDGRFIEVDYYRKGDNYVLGHNHKIDKYSSKRVNRVKEIKQPAGSDATACSTYKFIYNLPQGIGQTKTTTVYDAYNFKTEYHFNHEDRLTHVVKYDANEQPYSSERLFWGTLNTSQQINLQWRIFGNALSNEKEYARTYAYDSRGNILHDTLFGIITGDNLQPFLVNGEGAPIDCGAERRTTSYTYTDMNCVKTMQEGAITVEYSYYPGTTLLESTLYRDAEGIFRRQFNTYDENALVIEQISDDGTTADKHSLEGATERFITRTTRSQGYPFGLPLKEVKTCVDISSGTELPIGTKVQVFDGQGRMRHQETYGADGILAYSRYWEYNPYGNITLESDPLGRTTLRTYDPNGNCLSEEGPIPGLKKIMAYDRMNRLISLSEQHEDGTLLTQQFRYDLKGNKVCSIDALGNSTHHHYDAFGRMVYEEGPGIENLEGGLTAHTAHLEYNTLSQVIKQTDAHGHETRTKYTILGQPYEIIHADGTIERMKYNLQGELIEAISPTGALTRYIRDGRGRVLRTELYTPEGTLHSVTQCRYNQTHLIEEIDALGNVTTYSYDPYGRLKTICKQDQWIEYEYDALSRKVSTLHCNPEKTEGTRTRLTLDAIGQVLEERVEDITGELFTLSQFKYDELGRKVEVTAGDATSYFKYDTHGVLVESIDPEGNITTQTTDYFYFNSFGQRVLKTTAIDPKGNQTITFYDIRGQKRSVDNLDPYGALLHHEEYIYDLNGNMLQKIATPEPKRVYRFVYDSMNRLIETYQAYGTHDQKQYNTTYNAFGFKEALIKPDGVMLHFTHDCFGRMIACSSSDGSVHDQYHYDTKNNPIEVHNLITNKKSLRTFDPQGKILQETNQNGLITQFTYCYDGSIHTFTLPDSTLVEYKYKAGFLVEAQRKNTQGKTLYTHRILTYDKQGNILREELPSNLGLIERTLSPNGNLLAMHSPYFGETEAAYDPLGNLLSRTLNDIQGTYSETFSYDSLNQIKEEKGLFNHTYQHDSHQNRLAKDDTPYEVNQLNQILSTGSETLTYDLNGNLLSIGAITCTYDAFDRLITASQKGSTAVYSYDELHRCIQRNDQRYFYITQAEVGACNTKNKVTEFQMVGPGRASAPCQALTIEIDGTPYAALHDQSGHTRATIPFNKRCISTYRYSAFGEKKHLILTPNPWTFAGKREDPLTSWILFGRRFYLPTIGRFLTQDPAGLSASPNLYSYLANSPLVRYDTYGLFESDPGIFSVMKELSFQVMHISTTLLTAPFHVVNNSRIAAGGALHALSRNLIPIPYVKDIPQAAGYFIANLNLKNYVPSFKEDHAKWIEGDGWERPGVRHTCANGMGNTKCNAKQMQQSVQEAYHGERCDLFYAPSHGFLQDLGECLVQKLGIRTHQVRAYEKGMKKYCDEVGPNGVVTADNHSRGGITLSRVLPNLTDHQISKLWINTYGSGSIVETKGAKHVMNHISRHDAIPLVGDPYTYASSLFKTPSHVQFLPSSSWGFEHGFQGNTYQKALNKSASAFMNKFK